MVEIVKIQAADWSQYRSVRLDALRESPGAYGSTFDEEASNPDSWWRERLVNCDAGQDRPLFAMAGGDVVGLAWGKLEVGAAEKIGQVYQMWVRGNARGLGIGRLLLQDLVGWFRERGATVASLWSSVGETPANRLYAALGFIEAGSRTIAARSICPVSQDGVDAMRLHVELVVAADRLKSRRNLGSRPEPRAFSSGPLA
ncbi:MAG: GNAT family N-acetyltransferase [Burkholderiaceae bacterium]